MKNKALILLELRKLWGINALRYGKDRRGYRIMAAAGPQILAVMLAFYLGTACYGLLQIGVKAAQVQTLMLTAISALLLMIGFFRTGAQLFSGANSDILISLPVEPGQILFARWLRLYLEALPLAVLPMIAVLIVLGSVGPIRELSPALYLVSAPFLPLLPIAVSGLLSILTERLTGGKRRRFVWSAALTAAEFLVIGSAIKLVPVSAMQISHYLIYWGVSLVMTSVMTGAAKKAFYPILEGRKPVSEYKNVSINGLKRGKPYRALVRREWKQYLSHGTYVTNTVIGPVMAVVLSAGLVVIDFEKLGGPAELEPMIPFFPALALATMNPTACSVSIEGKNWWILKSMPLKTRDLVCAKVSVGLTIPLISAVISGILLTVRGQESMLQLLSCLLVPVSAAAFSAVWGLLANFRFPNFQWKDEAEIVKQGASAVVGGLVPSLLVLICGGLSLRLPDWGGAAASGFLFILSALLLPVLSRQKLPD